MLKLEFCQPRREAYLEIGKRAAAVLWTRKAPSCKVGTADAMSGSAMQAETDACARWSVCVVAA